MAYTDQITPRYGPGLGGGRGMEYDWQGNGGGARPAWQVMGQPPPPAYGGGTAISGSGAPVGGAGAASGGMALPTPGAMPVRANGASGMAPTPGAMPTAPDAAYKRYLDLLMNPAQAFQNPEYQAILQQGTEALGKSAANNRMRFAGKTMADFQTLGQRTAAGYLGQIANQYAGAAGEERARYGADLSAQSQGFNQSLNSWNAQQGAEQARYGQDLSANNQWFNQTLSAWNAQQQAQQQDYLRRLSEWSNYTGIQAR